MLVYPKKIKGERSVMSFYTDANQTKLASAIATLKNETLSDVIRRAIDLYVAENKGILGAAMQEAEQKELG